MPPPRWTAPPSPTVKFVHPRQPAFGHPVCSELTENPFYHVWLRQRLTATPYHDRASRTAFIVHGPGGSSVQHGQTPRPGPVQPIRMATHGSSPVLGHTGIIDAACDWHLCLSLRQRTEERRRNAGDRTSVGHSFCRRSSPTTCSNVLMCLLFRWSAINIGTSALSLLTSGYEILRTVTQSLTPRTMLATSLIKLFGVMLSMIMDDLVLGTDLDSWAAGIMVIHSFLL